MALTVSDSARRVVRVVSFPVAFIEAYPFGVRVLGGRSFPRSAALSVVYYETIVTDNTRNCKCLRVDLSTASAGRATFARTDVIVC